MGKLNYPTLDLFVYTLIKGLGNNREQVRQNSLNYQTFWENLPKQLEKSNTSDKESLKVIKTKPLKNDVFTFQGWGGKKYLFDGRFKRDNLDDSDGLWFDCSVLGAFDDIKPVLENLKSLAPAAPAENIQLGQTWIVSGWLSKPSDTDTDSLIQDAYKAIVSHPYQYKQTGYFLGTTFVELWRGSEKWEGMEPDSHVMILLYPDELTMATLSKVGFYDDVMRLLFSRHKITWAYEQSRQLKDELFNEFSEAIPKVQNLSHLSLKELKVALQENVDSFAKYALRLNYLEVQLRTIDVNLQNYKTCYDELWHKIKVKASGEEVNLDCLSEFRNIVTRKYKVQLEKDYGSLSPGMDVLENVTETIRGMVEIEQSERDRSFQNNVAIVGVGVSIASVVASAAASEASAMQELVPIVCIPPPCQLTQQQSNLLVTLNFSILVGAIASLITERLIVFLSKRSSRKGRSLT